MGVGRVKGEGLRGRVLPSFSVVGGMGSLLQALYMVHFI